MIGIGLNANMDLDSFPRELRSHVTSLKHAQKTARPLVVPSSPAACSARLDAWYGEGLTQGPESLNAPWRDRSEHLGRQVCVVTPWRAGSRPPRQP